MTAPGCAHFAFPSLAKFTQADFGWISLLEELLQGGGRRWALVRTHRNLQGTKGSCSERVLPTRQVATVCPPKDAQGQPRGALLP